MSDEPMRANDAAASDETGVDTTWAALQAERTQRVSRLRQDARSVWRAMAGWPRARTPEEWDGICQAAVGDLRSGRFVINQLGAGRFLDPEETATLWILRQALVADGRGTASEAMLADLAVIAYHHTLRLQRWIGDLALAIEREFFGEDGPSARFDERYGRGTGLVVEQQLTRLGEELLPLLERANRMTLRNLAALREQRRPVVPAVAINRAEQVNLGAVVAAEQRHQDGPGADADKT